MAAALKPNWPVVGGALLAAGLTYLGYRSFARQKAKAAGKVAGGDAKNETKSDAKGADAKAKAEVKAQAPTQAGTTFVILQHSDTVPPAFLLDFLTAKGARVRIVRLESEPLPQLSELNAAADVVVSLGGHMGAYEDALYPQWMPAEKQLMRDCVARDVPVLGICLGAQLLADALGGKAFPAPAFEGGFVPIQRTAAGDADRVMGAAFKQPVLLHHGDTFTLPPQAVLLAQTVYPQAFRLGSALAVQFHPEARIAELEKWSATAGSAKRYASVGLTRDGLLADAKRVAAEQLAASQAFFDAWWSSLPPKYTA